MNLELFDLHDGVEQSHWWFVSRREIVSALLRELLPAPPPPLVVDVGCGTGATIAGLSEWCRGVGIDTSERAITLAQNRYPGARFLHGFAPADLGEIAGEADAFLIMDVLEHVEDDRGLLRGVVEAARPGAYVIATVPADMTLWSDHDVNFGHYRRYSAAGLRSIWAGLPVEPMLVSHFNSRLYPAIRVARALGRHLRIQWGHEKTDLGTPPSLLNRALHRIFTGERGRLERVLAGKADPYTRGVSLIAVLRRTGEAAP